jgi:iron(III) transport system ATP-binding protein
MRQMIEHPQVQQTRAHGDDPAVAADDARGIRIQGLRKYFTRKGSRDRVVAIDGIDIVVNPGELVVLLGASGCGKTTILRCLAGLDTPDAGEIVVDGRTVFSARTGTDVPASKRRMSVIFQGYALWPHMTVYGNVVYPLRCQGFRRSTALSERVEGVLTLVGLAGLGKEYPGTLSGGQQQRVALARALVSDPPVVLFDEPLSNVDAQVRHQLRQEIWSMHQRVGFSALYVTHDQEEALSLADKIVLLHDGLVVQQGTPEEIYLRPQSRYAAEFIGRANTIEATLETASNGLLSVTTPVGTLHVPASAVADGARAHAWVVLRPEDLVLLREGSAFDGVTIRGSLVSRDFLGSTLELRVRTESGAILRVETPKGAGTPDGDSVVLGVPTSAVRVVGA